MHIARQIYNRLMQANNILIVPHQNPDGDSLGCSAAMAEFLFGSRKTADIFCATPNTHRLCFLPHVHDISQDESLFDKADLILIMDSGDLRYAGVDRLVKRKATHIINIDHHPTNEYFGELNWVVPEASSTSEIIYCFLTRNRARINNNMATSLLTGLVTDTDNFSNPAASAGALKVASDLLRLGGNFKLINKTIAKNKTVNLLKLWGAVFSRLVKNDLNDIAHTFITLADFQKFGINDHETEGIANFLNNLSDAKIALILKETPDGKIKGSLRTTKDNVDVAALAKKMGGGGHKKAAGFSAQGTIDEVLNRLLAMQ